MKMDGIGREREEQDKSAGALRTPVTARTPMRT
jgi:hypothetical protein